MSSSATNVQRPRLVATCWNRQIYSVGFTVKALRFCTTQSRRTLTACLAWMLADPSARMFLKMGFRLLNTSSLSIPEPSWMQSRQAKEAAARCSSPLPGRARGQGINFSFQTRQKNKACLRAPSCSGTFLEATFDAVCDGHPSLGDELVQNPCGHCRLKPVQCTLSCLGTKEKKKNRHNCSLMLLNDWLAFTFNMQITNTLPS